MKYMGSKISMMNVGLSEIISQTIDASVTRFVDLFSGSGAVARQVAESCAVPVDAVDSQLYAKVLSGAVTMRTAKADLSVINDWVTASRELHRRRTEHLISIIDDKFNGDIVHQQRLQALQIESAGFITRHYGGHYFSLDQAIALDCLYVNLPKSKAERSVALAAILESASMCSASPGHTAQPFQPTSNLIKHIGLAWRRDPFVFAERQALSLSGRYAAAPGGTASQQDSLHFVKNDIAEGSVVFCDPPYSEVQYSRFYHVLEGIARGGWSEVSGAGRAPSWSARFSSTFSSRRGSTDAFTELFSSLAQKSATVILTFPDHMCSNGQSADSLSDLAKNWFEISSTQVDVSHSSLGSPRSSKGNRVPRRDVKESVMVFTPKG